jgi:hypothetical protein
VISLLKRAFGLDRCTWKGPARFISYVRLGVLPANLLTSRDTDWPDSLSVTTTSSRADDSVSPGVAPLRPSVPQDAPARRNIVTQRRAQTARKRPHNRVHA